MLKPPSQPNPSAPNLSAIDLNLLWVLHAVLAEGSVSAAAARLNVTAPAISNALSRLRGLLGDPLFVRNGRGLVATPRALELAPVLRQAFTDIAASLTPATAFDAATSQRELTVALSDAEQIWLAPRLARELARRMPNARLRVVSLDTFVSLGGLAGEHIDAAIGPPLNEPNIQSAKLYEEEAVYVARKDHPRLKRALTHAAFNGERHVDLHLLLGQGGAGHDFVTSYLAQAGLVRQIAITVPTFFAAAAVIAHSDYLGGLPARVAKALSKSFELKVLSGPIPPLTFEMYLHWHSRTASDPAAALLREAITAAAR